MLECVAQRAVAQVVNSSTHSQRAAGGFSRDASMSEGASLQNYNSELVKCIEDLREKREELNKSIAADEEEKAKIQNDLRILTERLSRINDNLARKIASRTEYDKTITETEGAYQKILESSQTLLHVLKREATNLNKVKQPSS